MLSAHPGREVREVKVAAHHNRFHHDEAERRRWQDPEAILAEIGLCAGDEFVDVGCGDGFFALPAARMVGPEGHVYGVDVDEESLAELRGKADAEGIGNLTLVTGEAEKEVLCTACADFVFFGIDLHDFYDQAKVLQSAMRMIKPSGKLVDLDWKKQPLDMGPPLEIKFSIEHASRLIEDAGFIVVSVSEPGPMHYMIVARPAGGEGNSADRSGSCR
jgi:ubiquinone/menaquinone biosynthesis C-methylase UbiE